MLQGSAAKIKKSCKTAHAQQEPRWSKNCQLQWLHSFGFRLGVRRALVVSIQSLDRFPLTIKQVCCILQHTCSIPLGYEYVDRPRIVSNRPGRARQSSSLVPSAGLSGGVLVAHKDPGAKAIRWPETA